jgi:hypothetical protein
MMLTQIIRKPVQMVAEDKSWRILTSKEVTDMIPQKWHCKYFTALNNIKLSCDSFTNTYMIQKETEETQITAAEMKSMRRTTEHTWTDCTINEATVRRLEPTTGHKPEEHRQVASAFWENWRKLTSKAIKILSTTRIKEIRMNFNVAFGWKKPERVSKRPNSLSAIRWWWWICW